jgi:sugar transferase (PEP-CTERM/EpsH1 system associated)
MSQAPLIAHVVYHFGTGGMENGMVNLINHLPEGRYRHAIISLAGHTEFKQRIRRGDVSFHDLDKRPGHDYSWYARLARLLRELRPAIVHTRNLNALEAQFVAAWLGIPGRVHGEHGRDVFDLEGRNWKYNLLRRAARPLVHRYIAVSRDLAGWLTGTVGARPDRVTQIYNGVDGDMFHPRGAARPDLGPPGFFAGARCVIGSVGRMAAVKDYPTLARAFIRLNEIAPDPDGLRLVIVGEGEHRAVCQRLLEDAGLAQRAWLPGNRDDTAELLRGLDVFVLPSLGEGISNTILEAMATGLPVVASRVGGNPELVREDVTGTLFPAGDAEALAEILSGYCRDAGRCRYEGQAARARIDREFTLERMTAAYQAVYASVLGTGAA